MYKITKYNETKLNILFNPDIRGKIGIIESGIITVINGVVASDPWVPLGGRKKSGFARELSRYGIEFTNIKSVRLYEELVSMLHVEWLIIKK